jgi:uncharacterized protein (TIGR00369 family)
MELKMDIPALEAFLAEAFSQVAGQIRVTELTQDGLIAGLKVNHSHLRPGGTVSGPTMFMLTDVGVYLAVLSRIGPVALTVTTNCSIDFMRKPAAGADLICKVELLKLGRTLAVGDAKIYSVGQAAPVARATMTYAIPPIA